MALFAAYLISNKKTKQKDTDETIHNEFSIQNDCVTNLGTPEDGIDKEIRTFNNSNHYELSALRPVQGNVSQTNVIDDESNPKGLQVENDGLSMVNSTAPAPAEHETSKLSRANRRPSLFRRASLLSLEHKRTLLLARLASFVNGASFACHISLLPIQVTSLVDLDGKAFHGCLNKLPVKSR